MPFQLPVTLDFGALPDTGQGYNPQEFADRLGINGRVFTEQQFALFVTGATAPTSDVGPWAANGNEWRYWDSGTGSYVPFVIPSESLGYYVGSDTPDPTIYQFWIELAPSGSPLALKTYFSGAWVDAYATTLSSYLTTASAAATYKTITSFNADIAAYLTTATAAATYQPIAGMSAYATLASPAFTGVPIVPTAAPATNTTQAASTAFVAAAIAAIPVVTVVAGQGIFRATPSSDQDVVHGGAGSINTDVTLGTEAFDPDNAFAANIFTAPATGYYSFSATVQLSVTAGAPTDVDYWGIISTSGGTSIAMSGRDDTATGQAFSTGSGVVQMNVGQTAKLSITSNADAACTVRINSGGTFFSGFRVR